LPSFRGLCVGIYCEEKIDTKMHLNSDISEALQHIEIVKKSIEESSDPKLQMNTADDIKLILDLLQVRNFFVASASPQK
jgi:hypothetical protein